MTKTSYDLLIKNGMVVDGAGNPWYRSDIAIKEGKIVKIRPQLNEEATSEIDATGLVVCPGFIDMHSHTDFILAFYSKMDSFIRQGITTAVVGMCGQTLAPIHPERVAEFKQLFTSFLPTGGDIKIQWNSFEEYLDKMEKTRVPSNLVFFVGYQPIRIAAGLAFENRPPTSEEMEKMKEYVAEAMEAGAFGLSTGLIYSPQVFAKTDEIIELAKVAAEYNGLYFSHIRGEGENLINSVKELIEIVEKSGCIGGQIAHHKVSGARYWGTSKETIRLMEEANERGLSITCDQYPFNRGQSGLITALPPWVQEGGTDKILERLKDPEILKQIKKDVAEGIEGWENWIKDNGFERIFITFVKNKDWKAIEGKNISEITKIKGKSDDWETIFAVLLDNDAGVPITIETMGEDDIRRIMTSRYQMIGTDGAGVPHLAGLKAFHPRFFGTYPRILGRYVREEKLLTLEEVIRKMTSFPAQRLGLSDRGLIKEGMWADIVVFNPDTVIDVATYENPHQFPEGILHVIVNGMVVVENNKQKRVFPGKILRRPY